MKDKSGIIANDLGSVETAIQNTNKEPEDIKNNIPL